MDKIIKDRMDGLVTLSTLDNIIYSSIDIYEDLIEEGFDHYQIKQYLNDTINNVLSFQKESRLDSEDCQLRVIDGGRK